MGWNELGWIVLGLFVGIPLGRATAMLQLKRLTRETDARFDRLQRLVISERRMLIATISRDDDEDETDAKH